MTSIITEITSCRLCKNNELSNVISLGEQIITSRFPVYGDFSTPKTPIDLCKCNVCGLLQLRQTTFSTELYEYEYGYRSGISNTMRLHLKDYQSEILYQLNVELNDNDMIVDIGSNDSTMLQYYDKKYKRIGVDPTGNQFFQYYETVELIPTYFTYENFRKIYPSGYCKIVSSISMFYDLPDPVQFAKDINSILDIDGIWTCEQSYMPTMLKTNSIDTICHEHLEYYSLIQIKRIAEMSNFKIIDVKFNSCNGGSFRVYFAKCESLKYVECTELINSIIQTEIDLKLMNDETYTKFILECQKEVSKLNEFINHIRSDDKNMHIYGASTKGNCLLQFANIGEDKIKYAVERNPKKIGKMTNTGIEIISEDTMRNDPPNYLLVLPWHFREEIIQREQSFLKNGGQLVFPFPQFEIVSYKPKIIITGCDGMISSYLKEELHEYTLYGITRKSNPEQNITKYVFDMNSYDKLEQCILSIHPDTIIHMASISSSNYAFNNPLKTLQSNGLLTATLCDIIHRHKLQTKLFNASSSEIYKGHVNYLVCENDNNMRHLHPYSIAKILSHTMIQFYRNTYGLPFSNGTIFTTESERKGTNFLLNKVKAHAKIWKETNTPLLVGSLESYRNILHATDVVSAIKLIICQSEGDDYLICNDHSVKIYDLVIQIYFKQGIQLKQCGCNLYDIVSGLKVVIIEDNLVGFDMVPTNISGECVKLKKLGWSAKIMVNDIL